MVKNGYVTLGEHLLCRQASGEMAPDGQPATHSGHQHLLPAVPLAGTQIHEEQGALPAPQNSHRLQLQHGLPQLLHLQGGKKPTVGQTSFPARVTKHIHKRVLLFSQLFMAARAASYSYICQPVDYSDDPNEVRVSVLAHRQTPAHTHDSLPLS